jgi:uncharacterized membrane protein YqjE
MNPDQSKAAVGSLTSALLAQGALYGQLAWLELKVERHRLMQILLTLLVGFSMLTSVLVSVTTLLLVASWDTPWRSIVLVATGAVYCTGFVVIWLRFSALTEKSNQAFSDTREELAADFALLRNRLEQ